MALLKMLVINLAVAGLLLAGNCPAKAEPPGEVLWARQFGTSSIDYAYCLSADGLGNAYVAGSTYGSIAATNAGAGDILVSKYNVAGSQVWARQFGTYYNDRVWCISADRQGSIFFAGDTRGSLAATNPNHSEGDVFVGKYDSAGSLAWVRQFGTTASETASGISADGSGNCYVAGWTQGAVGGPNAGGQDTLVCKYDGAGTRLWLVQAGTSGHDAFMSASCGSQGDVYVSGYTNGLMGGSSFGDQDALLAKYNAAGNLVWMRQFGTSAMDSADCVTTDGRGGVIVFGRTTGSLGAPNAGGLDVYLRKYDEAGDLLWTSQLGTAKTDTIGGLSADAWGNLYVTGTTSGSIGAPNAGAEDLFVAKYDPDGDLLWTIQLGTTRTEYGEGIAVSSLGNVFLAGITDGSLGGANAGSTDVFVALITPEPGTLGLLVLGGLLAIRRRRRK